jgi:flagellar biosynthetic protein FliP
MAPRLGTIAIAAPSVRTEAAGRNLEGAAVGAVRPLGGELLAQPRQPNLVFGECIADAGPQDVGTLQVGERLEALGAIAVQQLDVVGRLLPPARPATAPPNAVIISLALFLTAFVMGPAFQRAYDAGVKPLIANEVTAEQAFERASGPFKEFMLKNVRDKDLKLFNDLAKEPAPASPDQISLRILIPAFMISELKRAFEIGFLLFLPFLIIDLVVASVLMSMGMMMLPPVVVSLPFKLIFFVLVDGWSLVAGSLVQSYGSG